MVCHRLNATRSHASGTGRRGVLAFVSPRTWADSKRFIEPQRGELLTDAADWVFAVLPEQHQAPFVAGRSLKEHRVLLARCVTGPITTSHGAVM
jgi:hypothetical protein